jgi:hypothetical protein
MSYKGCGFNKYYKEIVHEESIPGVSSQTLHGVLQTDKKGDLASNNHL